jgi:hypothetical protein
VLPKWKRITRLGHRTRRDLQLACDRNRRKGANGMASLVQFAIAQTRQRGDLIPKSPGIAQISVKDAYPWSAAC